MLKVKTIGAQIQASTALVINIIDGYDHTFVPYIVKSRYMTGKPGFAKSSQLDILAETLYKSRLLSELYQFGIKFVNTSVVI